MRAKSSEPPAGLRRPSAGGSTRRALPLVALISLFCLPAAAVEEGPSLQLKTTTRHPMQYHLALPAGWTAQKTWPVIVAIPDATRDFPGNAAAFVRARKDQTFIIVAPHVLTGGGANYRAADSYHYTDAVWQEAERVGAFRFDSEGIAAVIADVHRLYGGEEKYFLTGWEAGGHTVWAMIFQHPDALRGAAPVSSNYLGRWTSESDFSTAAARRDLPVKVFFCGAVTDDLRVPWNHLHNQTEEAIRVAGAHGFRPIPLVVAEGKPHGPLADEVLAYFSSLLPR